MAAGNRVHELGTRRPKSQQARKVAWWPCEGNLTREATAVKTPSRDQVLGTLLGFPRQACDALQKHSPHFENLRGPSPQGFVALVELPQIPKLQAGVSPHTPHARKITGQKPEAAQPDCGP